MGETRLVNAALLPRDVSQCLPQHSDVINAQCSDPSYYRLRYDVRAVVRAANTDLQDGRVNLHLQEGVEGHEGDKAEVSWHDGGTGELPL